MMRRKHWILLLAIALVAPAGLVAAGSHGEDGDPGPYGEDNHEDRTPPARHDRQGFEKNGSTYAGTHVSFTLDAGLPGITNLTVAPNATPLVAQVTLPDGDDGEWENRGPVFEMESNGSQLQVLDMARAILHVDADEDAPATITLADGINVSLYAPEDTDDEGEDEAEEEGDGDTEAEDENETDTEEDDGAVYRLALADGRTFYLFGEDLTYENGTFTVANETTLTALPTDLEDAREKARERMEEARERREEARERMEEARERMEERRHKRSHFSEDNGTITGRYVSFQATDTGIEGYHLSAPNVTVFATVDVGPNATDRMQGATYQVRGEDAGLRIIDQPHGLMVLKARDNGTISLTLADGVNATLRAQEADDGDGDEGDDDEARAIYQLALPGNLTAYLAGEDLTHDNGTFTLGDDGQFRLRTMAAHPYDGDDEDDDGDDERRGPPANARARAMDHRAAERVQEAIAQGQVAVEVYTDSDNGTPVAFELGHVKVRGAAADAKGPVKAKVDIEAPDDAPGTTVVLNLNRSDLGNLTVAQAASELAIRYDGQNISAADDLEDALDWTDDDGQPEYLLLVGGEQIQAFVTVPHFSPHTVEVYQVQTQEDATVEDDGSRGTPMPGALATIAVALAAVALTRRSRSQR